MHRFTLLFFVMVSSLILQAQVPRFIQAQLFYSQFLSPEDGPYLETFLSIAGPSIRWVEMPDGQFQGNVEVTLIFRNRKDEIVHLDKYELVSPLVKDTSDRFLNLIDQQRFLLPNGEYELELRLKDLNSNTPAYSATQTIEMNIPANEVAISGIQLIESYRKTDQPSLLTKSGYDMFPYIFNFLPADVQTLSFYAEIYNTSKVLGEEEMFLINYYIESFESKRKLEKFSGFRRVKAAPVNVLFTNYNISGLPSGNYNLVVEARNRNNELLASNSLFFQRSNPSVGVDYTEFSSVSVENSFVNNISNADTLREYIRYLVPIATDLELTFIRTQIEKKLADLDLMQRFFLHFWLERDPLNPENSWNHYLAAVRLVNERFGAPGKKGKKGYETDMGYVFLRYGPPNVITDRPFDSGASGMTINPGDVEQADYGSVPYQIWHYYSLNGLRDRKFVFANPHLALNDYRLIHSNMPGEIQNENWQAELHYRFNTGTNLPDGDRYRGRSGDFYNNPR